MMASPPENSFIVSVVIPAYNAAAFIAKAIDSVLAQTLPAHEIIVVDDGSTDNTSQIVASYGSRVRYLHQLNAGVAAARNTGIEAAVGNWIAFLDADDQWLPQKLQRQIDLLKRNPQLVWTASNFTMCFASQDRRKNSIDPAKAATLLCGSDYFDDYFQAFIQHSAGWTGTMLINSCIFEQIGRFRPGTHCGEDLDLWWRIAHRFEKIGYDPEPLALYHCDVPDSLIKTHTNPDITIDLINRHLKLADKYRSLEQFLPCARHMLQYSIHNYLFDERIYRIREIIVTFDKILPAAYKSAMRLLTIYPRATLACMPILSKINKLLRIPL